MILDKSLLKSECILIVKTYAINQLNTIVLLSIYVLLSSWKITGILALSSSSIPSVLRYFSQ